MQLHALLVLDACTFQRCERDFDLGDLRLAQRVVPLLRKSLQLRGDGLSMLAHLYFTALIARLRRSRNQLIRGTLRRLRLKQSSSWRLRVQRIGHDAFLTKSGRNWILVAH